MKDVLDPKFKAAVSKVLDKFRKDLYSLHDMATRDEKTGIYNHRFFKSIFSLELEKAKRGKQRLAFAIIDIDFFKKFNDTYGHLLGDEILYELAQHLLKVIRKYDVVARFGGEEFFVLLPATTLTQAKRACERMRKSLFNNAKLKKYGVTISLGVTEYKNRDTMQRMIKRADKGLYDAKKKGRNQVGVL